MKRYMWVLALVCCGISGLSLGVEYYEIPQDYSVVNAIQRKSNLTQSDVDKLNLLFLGPLQNIAAVGAGGYAAYAAGVGAYQLGGEIEKSGAVATLASYLPKNAYLPDFLADLLSDKRTWAALGAIGAGVGAYKVLYSRVAAGILEQVKTYVQMCENLDVYNYTYDYDKLPGMGASGKEYLAAWRTTNAAWSASNSARKKGIDNLLEQARCAIQLLAKLESTREVQNLQTKIRHIQIQLERNKLAVDWAAQQELQHRASVSAMNIGGAQQAAQLALAKEQASALWYGKISLAATAASNFAKNTLKTLTYLYDNKEKIAGGLVTIYFLPTIVKKAWEVQQKFYGQPQ